jgi:hypothetical protein
MMMIGPVASSLITLVALVVWLICACIAGYSYWSAYLEARPRLAPQFQDSRIARLALDTLIWDAAIAPKRARRQYLISHVFAAISAIPLAVCVWVHGQFVGAAIFTALGVCGAGVAFYRWRKYKDLL